MLLCVFFFSEITKKTPPKIKSNLTPLNKKKLLQLLMLSTTKNVVKIKYICFPDECIKHLQLQFCISDTIGH